MALKLPVSVVIRAVDRVTEPIRRIRAGINRFTAPLRELRGKLGTLSDAAGFPSLRRNLTKSWDAVRDLGSEVFSLTARLGGLALGATAAGFAVVRSFASMADSIGDSAAKLRVSTTNLQGWRYAAKLADVDAAALDRSLAFLGRTMDAAREPGSQAARVFRQLGVAVKGPDGKLRSLNDVLPEIADRLTTLKDKNRQLGFAQALLGKSGAQLIPMLLAGSQGLRDATAEARALGAVLDEETIAAGGALADELDRVETAVLGVRNAIGAALTPVVHGIARDIRKWIQDNLPRIRELAAEFARWLPGALRETRDALRDVWQETKPLRDWLRRLYEHLGPVKSAVAALAVVLAVSLGPAIAATVVSLATLSTAILTTPAGWIALGASVLVLTMYLDDFLDGMEKTSASLGDAAVDWPKHAKAIGDGGEEGLGGLLDTLRDIGDVLKEVSRLWTSLDKGAHKAGASVREAIGNATGFNRRGNPIGDLRFGIQDWLQSLGGLGSPLTRTPFGLRSGGVPASAPFTPPRAAGALPSPGARADGGAAPARAEVLVKFSGAPRGMVAKPGQADGDVDVDLDVGYAGDL